LANLRCPQVHANDIAASRLPWYRRLERSPNPIRSTHY